MVMQVHVTEKHLADGLAANSYHCPIANAMAEALPDATRILVDVQTIRYTLDGVRYVHLTPQIGARAIIDVDAGNDVAPFSFWLRDPIWKGKRVPARNQGGYTDVQQSEQEEKKGTARIYVAKASATKKNPGGAQGEVLRVDAVAPPARYHHAFRIKGLRMLPMNRPWGDKGKEVVDTDTPS